MLTVASSKDSGESEPSCRHLPRDGRWLACSGLQQRLPPSKDSQVGLGSRAGGECLIVSLPRTQGFK